MSEDYAQQVNPEELELEPDVCLNQVKCWLEREAEMNGRTDDEFLLLFLRGCKYNVEKCKAKLRKYYSSRKNVPQWWANRNLENSDILSLLRLKKTTALIDKVANKPLVIISTLSRYGPNLGNFDEYLKLSGLILETALRRRSCQFNGIIWILDARNYPMWFAIRMLSPIVAFNFVNSFYYAMPVRIKHIFMLNTPAVARAFFNLIRPFVTSKLMNRIHQCGGDWSELYEHVPLELLPEEYGGKNGTIAEHDDAFVDEVLNLSQYFQDDNKFGYSSTKDAEAKPRNPEVAELGELHFID